MQPVELLTVGLWHDSIGDIALMQATVQQLAMRGVPVIPVSYSSGLKTCIVGGGHLLVTNRTPDRNWWKALKAYHLEGAHILNAVGVHEDGGNGTFDFLKNYLYVSVRDDYSKKILQRYVDNVVSVPCVATLLQKPNLEYFRNLPTYRHLDELLDTEYVVIDTEMCDRVKTRYNKCPVDTRPWMSRGGPNRLTHRNPDALLALIAGAKAVVASSLHLSIMAMAMDVPFVYCTKSNTSEKGYHYYERAGLLEAMYSGDDPVDYAISLVDKMRSVRAREILLAIRHLDMIVEVLREKRSSDSNGGA